MLIYCLLTQQQEGIHAGPHQKSRAVVISVCWPQGILRSIRMVILVTAPVVFSCFMIREPAIQQVPAGFVDWLSTSIVYLHSLLPWWRFRLSALSWPPSFLLSVVGILVKCRAFLHFIAYLCKVNHWQMSVVKADRITCSTNSLNQLWYLCHCGLSNFPTSWCFLHTVPLDSSSLHINLFFL